MKAIVLCFAIFLSQATHAAQLDRHLYGVWKVTAVLDSQETTSLSDDEANKLIGTQLVSWNQSHVCARQGPAGPVLGRILPERREAEALKQAGA